MLVELVVARTRAPPNKLRPRTLAPENPLPHNPFSKPTLSANQLSARQLRCRPPRGRVSKAMTVYMHMCMYVSCMYVLDGQRGSVLPRWCDPSSLRTRASARGLDHSSRGKALGEGGASLSIPTLLPYHLDISSTVPTIYGMRAQGQ